MTRDVVTNNNNKVHFSISPTAQIITGPRPPPAGTCEAGSRLLKYPINNCH